MPFRPSRALLIVCMVIGAALISGCTIPTDVTSPSVATIEDFPGPPKSIAVADFDGSGAPDVLVGFNSVDVAGLSLVKQDNYGFWTRTTPSGLAFGSALLALTDVDANGTPDVIAADPGTNLLNVMKNNGSGSFTSAGVMLPDGAQILKLASATAANGERWVAALYQWGSVERFRLYRATGGGLQAAPEPEFHMFSFVGPTNTMILANVFGDSAPDVVLGENDGSVRIYMGNVNGPAYTSPSPFIRTTAGQSHKVTALAAGDAVSPASAGDWNRDGFNDLLVGYHATGAISGFRGDAGILGGVPQTLGAAGFAPSATPTSLSIDAATGKWASTYDPLFSIVRGSKDSISGSIMPIGCDPTRAVSMVPSADGKPVGAMLCGDSNRLLVVADRKRLSSPTSASFGNVNLGATGSVSIQTGAPDFLKDNDLYVYSGRIQFDLLKLLNDDSHQFSVNPNASSGCPGLNSLEPFASAFHFETCAFPVSFTPTTPGTKTATLEIPNDSYRATGASAQRVALTGTAVGSIASLPASLDFSNVLAGSTRDVSVTLTNTGNASLSIASIAIDEPAGDWSTPSDTCSSALAAGASCGVVVRFAPSGLGDSAATLRLSGSQYGGDKTVALSGSGVNGAITGAPTDLGGVDHGDSASTSITLRNDDSATRTISDLSIVGSSEFSVTDSSNCLGLPLAPDASCSVGVGVVPTARGLRTAKLRVSSNATTPVTDVSLIATGRQGELGAIENPTNLGSLRAGFFKDLTIPLLNTGDAPLTIDTVEIGEPVSVTFACSDPIAPGATCDLGLHFAPTTEGLVSIPLQLHGDGVLATTTIDLTGFVLPNVDPAPPGAAPPTAVPGAGPGGGGAAARFELKRKRVTWKRSGRSVRLQLTVAATGAAVIGPKLAIDLPKPFTYRAAGKHRSSRKIRVSLRDLAPGASKTIQLRVTSRRDARKLRRRLAVKLSGVGLAPTTSRFTLR